MEERVSRLHGQLQRIQQAQHATSPGAKDIHRPCSVLNSINEDLHWIMLVAGISIMVFDEDDTLEYLGTHVIFLRLMVLRFPVRLWILKL